MCAKDRQVLATKAQRGIFSQCSFVSLSLSGKYFALFAVKNRIYTLAHFLFKEYTYSMKMFLSILLIVLTGHTCFAQEPALYGEWKVVGSAFDSIVAVMEKDKTPIKKYDTTYFDDGRIESIIPNEDLGPVIKKMFQRLSKMNMVFNPDGTYKTIYPDEETCEGRYRIDPVTHTITFLNPGASQHSTIYTLKDNQLYFPVSDGNCYWMRYERVSGR